MSDIKKEKRPAKKKHKAAKGSEIIGYNIQGEPIRADSSTARRLKDWRKQKAAPRYCSIKSWLSELGIESRAFSWYTLFSSTDGQLFVEGFGLPEKAVAKKTEKTWLIDTSYLISLVGKPLPVCDSGKI